MINITKYTILYGFIFLTFYSITIWMGFNVLHLITINNNITDYIVKNCSCARSIVYNTIGTINAFIYTIILFSVGSISMISVIKMHETYDPPFPLLFTKNVNEQSDVDVTKKTN